MTIQGPKIGTQGGSELDDLTAASVRMNLQAPALERASIISSEGQRQLRKANNRLCSGWQVRALLVGQGRAVVLKEKERERERKREKEREREGDRERERETERERERRRQTDRQNARQIERARSYRNSGNHLGENNTGGVTTMTQCMSSDWELSWMLKKPRFLEHPRRLCTQMFVLCFGAFDSNVKWEHANMALSHSHSLI